MLRRVLIKKAKGGISDSSPTSLNEGALPTNTDINRYGTPKMSVRNSLTAVPREEADLEAEGGETVVTNLNNDGIPEHYNIKGPRHTNGGVPLKLPEESFIFSDTKEMRICDPQLLMLIGVKPKKGKKCYTPAELAKLFDINKYKKILLDPDSDQLERTTAEMMIANFNKKLAQIALAQEAKKGFPDGVPSVAEPIMSEYQIDPNQLMATQGEEDMEPEEEANEMAKYGKEVRVRRVKISLPKAQYGRYNRRMYSGFPVPYGNPYYPYYNVGPNYNIGPYYYEQGVPVNSQRGYGAYYSTAPTYSTKVTKKQNVPKDAVIHDESSKNYNPGNVKAGDYVKGSDGKLRKVTGTTGAAMSGGSMSGVENYKKFYGTDPAEDAKKAKEILEQKSKDPNSGIKKVTRNGKITYDFYGKSTDALTLEEKALVTKLAGYGDKEMYGAKDFDLNLGVQDFNKYGFVGFVSPDLVEYQNWKSRKENWNKTEKDFEALNAEDKKANRLEYLKKTGYSEQEIENLGDRVNDPSKLYTPEFVGKPLGKKDNKIIGDPNSLVARTQRAFPHEQFRPYKEDDYLFGWEHADFYKRDTPEMQYEDVPEEDVYDETAGDFGYNKQVPADWFLQDLIGHGSAVRTRLNRRKYDPWQASPELYLADPSFVDYSYAAAQQNALANQMAQGAAAFAGPQAYSAQAARIYGQAAPSVAGLLADEANQNVGIANQFEMANTQMLNQDAWNRALAATQLYDKSVTADQLYQAEKDMARQEELNALTRGITNAANAQVLNSLYDQYQIAPITGGTMIFAGGRDMHPGQANEANLLGEMANLRETYPGWTEKAYQDAAKNILGINTSYDPFNAQLYYQQQQNMMRGVDPYDMG